MSGPAAADSGVVETVRVALVGRPNSGKTSVLMHLTGSRQRPVNFPGTSVERVESRVQFGERGFVIADLPGIVSLEAHSRDEQVAIDSLRDGEARPDLLCAVLDAQKLVVELQFLQELRSLGRPMVVVLTKLDLAEAAGRPIDLESLRRALGLPVVVINALTGDGVGDVRDALLEGGSQDLRHADAHQQLADSVQPASASRRMATENYDAVLLHRFFGPVILVVVMLAMFQFVFRLAEPFMEWIEALQELCGNFVGGLVADGALQSFLVDGLINGLGSALIFIPQIALLIAVVTVLESSGYMARAVFLLDLVLRKVGLTGRSFVPMTSSFACAIPGIMATRIITDERDRLATIAVSPLMSCSARLPVYVILLAAFFPAGQAGLMLFLLYALGIVTAAGVAFVLRKTVLRGGHSPLAMELPAYQRPSLKLVGRQVWQAVRAFLITAGSVILVATVVVWLLAYYPRPASIAQQYQAERVAAVDAQADEAALLQLDAREQAAYLEQSWLASIGKTVQPVFAPAGFDWRMTVGVLAAFPARELIIPTLGTLHSLGEVEADPDEPDGGLLDALQSARDAEGRPTMNGLVALALMAFFALCSQCAATLAAIRRETHSWRWPVFVFIYMTGLAWLVAVLIYQVGSWLGWGLPG